VPATLPEDGGISVNIRAPHRRRHKGCQALSFNLRWSAESRIRQPLNRSGAVGLCDRSGAKIYPRSQVERNLRPEAAGATSPTVNPKVATTRAPSNLRGLPSYARAWRDEGAAPSMARQGHAQGLARARHTARTLPTQRKRLLEKAVVKSPRSQTKRGHL